MEIVSSASSAIEDFNGYRCLLYLYFSFFFCGLVRSIRDAIHVQSVFEDIFHELPEGDQDCTALMETSLDVLEVYGTPCTTHGSR